jgi:C-terminal processing protease CtpA/Prc
MFCIPKSFLFTILTAALIASPVLAHNKKIDRTTSIPEKTLNRLAKDLAGLQRTVEKAAEDLAAPARHARIVCDDSALLAQPLRVENKLADLSESGYVVEKKFSREEISSFVGVGLMLIDAGSGALVVNTVPNSPARKTEFFDRDFLIKEVNGVSASGKSVEEIRAMIGMNGVAGRGVLITFTSLELGRRDVERYFELKRVRFTQVLNCVRMVPQER